MIRYVNILRFNPLIDKNPYYQRYDYEFENGITVLDVLHQIYEKQDSTLGYSFCCKGGYCGICGAEVNGKPVLLCKQVAIEDMVIEPLKNIRVAKDLIIDRNEYEKNLGLRLYLERQCNNFVEPECIIMDKYEMFKMASRCIACYSCNSICPVYKKNQHIFKGPAMYVLEARHHFDSRDEQNRAVLLKSEGIDYCIECGKCSQVCSNNVDPSTIIREIKTELMEL